MLGMTDSTHGSSGLLSRLERLSGAVIRFGWAAIERSGKKKKKKKKKKEEEEEGGVAGRLVIDCLGWLEAHRLHGECARRRITGTLSPRCRHVAIHILMCQPESTPRAVHVFKNGAINEQENEITALSRKKS